LDSLNTLLFELSSSDRLDILHLLKKTPIKLSQISATLDFTVQEASRNVGRLAEAGLIKKGVDSAFYVTPFGEEVLNLLKGLNFLSNNKDYFLRHSASSLPEQFRASLGVLESFTYVGDVMIAFHNVEKMIANAEKFVWIMTNQILASTLPYLLQELERGGEFKLLMPKDYRMTEEIFQSTRHPIFDKAVLNRKLDMRFIDKVEFFLCVSEKEVGAFSFTDLEGKLDYNGSFRAESKAAVTWAKGLFNYYLERSTSEIPDQITNRK
jgi:predicted transcriptional regulator